MSHSSLKRSTNAESLLEKILKEVGLDQYQNVADIIITEENLISELNKVMVIAKILKELGRIKKIVSSKLIKKMNEFRVSSIDGIKVVTMRETEIISSKLVREYFYEHHLDISQVMSMRKGYSYLKEV